MKPYIKLLFSKIKCSYIKLFKCRNFKTNGIQIFNFNARFIFGKKSNVQFGDRIINDGRVTMIVDNEATLKIGDNVYFNEDFMVSVKSSVTIGSGSQFGPNVKIFDNNHNFNSTDGVLYTHNSAPIVIGEHCWIGTNCVILRGTHIGNNCVIAAGCIVKGDIPDGSIVSQSTILNIRPIEDRI